MANPKIQLRHDTAANWTSVNPVLLEGEVGIETDTKKFKVGDGVTNWTSLAYGNADTEAIEQLEQDYGSLISKVDNIEEDVDGKVGYDELDTPLAANPIYTDRTIRCDDLTTPISTNPINPVYYADLSYYKISGTWNYKQAQWSFSHYDDGGDIVLIKAGPANSQFRINNIPGCDNYIYHNVKIPSGGAPTWSLSFTKDYNVRLNISSMEEQIITLPEDIKGYFSSLEDKTFKTDVMLLTGRTAITYITLQEKSAQHLQLLYDNNTLKVNDSGQLYADVSTEPPANMVTTDTEQTITGAKTINTLTVEQISRTTTDGSYQLYDTSMNSTLSGLGMPSGRYVNLTLGTSGTIYVAPANGWFSIDAGSAGVNGFLRLCNNTTGIYNQSITPFASASLSVYVPARSGNKVTLFYDNHGSLKFFRFIYAEGEDY